MERDEEGKERREGMRKGGEDRERKGGMGKEAREE